MEEAVRNLSSSDGAALRIAGFGACMITGYPHQSGGLFEVACSFIEDTLQRSVRSNIISLGGFPAPRAAKYLRHKVFKFKPNYVVIQFGATDAKCSIRSRKHLIGGAVRSDASNIANHGQPANILS